jgi:adenosylmethionine-8-amino-7-oxononanoate aminotransferase
MNLPLKDKSHVWHPFTPMRQWCADDHDPLVVVSGRGAMLTDEHGREYIDGNSSIWTNIHGHNHPVINAAIQEQLGRLSHTSFLGLTNQPAIELAEKLVALFPDEKLSRVFYSDNGSTAIEVAIRMSLQYWKQNGRPERDTILAFDRAYHGDTLGAASLGGIPSFKGSGNDFGYRVIRAGSVDELNQINSADKSRLAAAIIEPLIQGAAGMRLWPRGMLAALHEWCRTEDVFLVLDEVMTGFGRTGRMFACEHEKVTPDFICLAKGLTGGSLPLAATLTTSRVFEGFLGEPGEGRTFFYGHSYCGNPLGCAAALGSLRVFDEEKVIESLPQKEHWLASGLERLQLLPQVRETRQIGLISAISLNASRADSQYGARVCLAARAHGLLTRPVVNEIVLMPPLCISESELCHAISALETAISTTA